MPHSLHFICKNRNLRKSKFRPKIKFFSKFQNSKLIKKPKCNLVCRKRHEKLNPSTIRSMRNLQKINYPHNPRVKRMPPCTGIGGFGLAPRSIVNNCLSRPFCGLSFCQITFHCNGVRFVSIMFKTEPFVVGLSANVSRFPA